MMDLQWNFILYFLGLSFIAVNCQERQQVKDRRRGSLIGKLKPLQHQVSGTLWAVDEDTLYIENFNYDGRGPDAFFWMGNNTQPSPTGILVPYPIDTPDKKQEVLPKFQNKNLILHLPHGLKIVDMKWFSVWCRRFTVDFGHVYIPLDLDPPKKRILPEFQRLAHGVRSGKVTILDAKTFYIPNLHYDGAGPDAFFWVGRGELPNQRGQKVPNEMGSLDILRSYEGEDIEIQLPDNLTVYDIDYLAIWCVEYRHNFGHVLIPDERSLWVPPALGQTRVNPAWWYSEINSQPNLDTLEFDNCLQLSHNLQVEWRPGQNSVEIKLTGSIDDDQYMAFGISGDVNKAVMINSDVVVAFKNKNDNSFHAVDYTITGKSMCDGVNGVCPDERVSGRNDASVIRGSRKDGITTVIYSRPYDTQDHLDIPIKRGRVAIIAAIGKLNTKLEANYHQEFVTRETIKIDFNSVGDYTCQALVVPKKQAKEYKAWPTTSIRDTYNFSATIGPTGGDRGYEAITGYPSWGISWWINGLLIPEIFVERGRTYYFTVEGGTNLEDPTKTSHHPFYITDNFEGGYHQKTMEEQKEETIYAGVKYSKKGFPSATAQGRLCKWSPTGTDSWRENEDFAGYKSSLHKECEDGRPGALVWTVMEDTPDLVYYQCYTHRHLGWKIHVSDKDSTSSHLDSSSSMPYANLWLLLVLTTYAFCR